MSQQDFNISITPPSGENQPLQEATGAKETPEAKKTADTAKEAFKKPPLERQEGRRNIHIDRRPSISPEIESSKEVEEIEKDYLKLPIDELGPINVALPPEENEEELETTPPTPPSTPEDIEIPESPPAPHPSPDEN